MALLPLAATFVVVVVIIIVFVAVVVVIKCVFRTALHRTPAISTINAHFRIISSVFGIHCYVSEIVPFKSLGGDTRLFGCNDS